ncbi:hypothetical protein [Okeania hirsuta]|uniref:hypothetical protein n=1 Tax=Okeania hirsuta TaxID=1458930 RepID=UPI00137530D0|nr:hypothetical protein [Okeania hirsuta]
MARALANAKSLRITIVNAPTNGALYQFDKSLLQILRLLLLSQPTPNIMFG